MAKKRELLLRNDSYEAYGDGDKIFVVRRDKAGDGKFAVGDADLTITVGKDDGLIGFIGQAMQVAEAGGQEGYAAQARSAAAGDAGNGTDGRG